ncbi:adenosine deaminase [Trematosphaeria pertusa]|uniref:Adenine deaminase n=1 Tax=Trematosphaeria pertusa TaxID=390896 RepID=A0A6A6IAJ8_9PLEO|nr:adenosine deaminase [Trematosphaeria pertusa]KAF2247279.1 adenosine deaminase [Trematosphaeria pertusa]
MAKASLREFLRCLPKCEHHMHLEGALSPQLLFELAAKNNTTLPQDDAAFKSPEALLERYRRFTSLDDFLHYYYIGMSVLITHSDFEALAWDYFRHAKADGVAHAELFFDPQAHTARGVGYSTAVAGFDAACKRAEKELGITSILTTCFLRHLPVEDSLAAFDAEDVQESYVSGVVKGIGLDSSENGYAPEGFKELFAKARHQGLNLTTHAGEEGPVSYIASALDNLRVRRIDHGIKLVYDEHLMKRIASENIMLTVCPLSNVVLRCVNTIKDVPIRKLLNAGVKFSINSDDPAYFRGYILDNYLAVQDAFGLSVEEWEGIVRAGINGSWCGEDRKTILLQLLKGVVVEWEERLEEEAGQVNEGLRRQSQEIEVRA